MDLTELLREQIALDELHGFPLRFGTDEELYLQITKDLVGLFGEVGEFSNIVKKINISLEKPDAYELDLEKCRDGLREELADAFIYVLRLSVMLNMDLEDEVRKKMEFNKTRYAELRRP